MFQYKQKPLLSSSYMMTVLLLATVSSIIFAAIWLHSEIDQFRVNEERIESDYIKFQRQLLQYEVSQAISYIKYEKSRTEEILKNTIRDRTYEAYALANGIYQKYEGKKSLSEIQELVVEALRAIKFNHDRGYYFAADLNGTNRLFGDKPDLEGQDLSDLKDSKGQHVVRDMIKLVRKKGEGYYQYSWPKPNTPGGEFPKIAFVKYFEPFGWFFGTGEYLDDVTKDIQREALKRIEEIRFGKDGYIFIGNYEGFSLTKPAKNRNMWDAQDENGVKIVQELISKARAGGGFVEYVMPRLEGLPSAPKLSYADKFDDWQWYVGGGIYVDEIKTELSQLRSELNERIRSNLYKIGITLLGMVILSIAIGTLFQRKLKLSLSSFSNFFSASANKFSEIDPENLKYREFINLAESANKMINARKASDKALRESHEWYKAVLDSLPSGIVVIDCKDHKIKDINPKACDLVGLKKEDILNQLCHNFVCPNEEGHCPILDLHQTVDNAERILLRYDGKRIPILKTVNRAILGGKEFIIEGFLDISDKKKLEIQLHQAQKMEAIGALAGGIAHDFNNILSVIIGYTELAMFNKGAETCSADLKEVLKAAGRAKDLVKQILAFSRQTDEETMPVKATMIVKEAVKFLRSTIPSTIEIKTQIDEQSGAVLANSVELHQIVMNLCTNAIHAMGESNGVLEINVQNTVVDNLQKHDVIDLDIGPYVKISVKDTGVGIAPEVMKRIFDPYFTTKEKGVGTGLGLAVVHGIIKKSAGAIKVESELGKGTVFHIYLPRVDPPSVIQGGPIKLPVGGFERILFIDDEKSLTDVGHRMLEHLGYDVVSRTSPIEALELFRSKPDHFDLVITDQTMPGMTGDKLAEEFLRIRPDIAIIICTGYSQMIDPERARNKGIREFVMKPILINDIADAIRKALNK
jgi:two-component system cell cycle sensor histidine kinase/response regulator CckA